MKPSELLTQRDWCQGALARDVSGNPYPPESSECVSWCMIGAIRKTCGLLYGAYIENIESKLEMPIGVWNDKEGRTKEEVIAKLKEFGL